MTREDASGAYESGGTLPERPLGVDAATDTIDYELSIGFGNQCNEYVDVIQQALDLALGNTGNLAPDRAVVDALEELYITARSAGATALLQLLVPLSKILRSAEQAGFTLSQADTLLVQEAIIAITLGIDSIVNQKSIPKLLTDVTRRVVDVAAENKHEVRANSEAAGLVDVFVADADERLQRLFEQIQRWRASAHGGSRGYLEISRLLNSLHDSADAAGLTGIATLVRLLIGHMDAQTAADVIPDGEFFDTAIDTIEVLGDDLDRIRNNEQLIEHTDLYERLAVDGVEYTASMQVVSATNDLEHVFDPLDLALGVQDIAVIDLFGNGAQDKLPERRELLDMLQEISQGQGVIRERIDQLRRTTHIYTETNLLPGQENKAKGPGEFVSAVSPIDNLFFKIDTSLSRQRKSITRMASALGMAKQQTVQALGAELEKFLVPFALTVSYLRDAERVVIDSQQYEHFSYALKNLLDVALSRPADREATPRAFIADSTLADDTRPVTGVVFDFHDDCLRVKIAGAQLSISEFVLTNANVRRVDEQMLKMHLPPRPDNDAKLLAAQSRAGRNSDLVALAAFQRLIDTVVFFRGKVASAFTDESEYIGGEIEMTLPVSAVNEEVVIVKKGQQLYAVQSAEIDRIERLADGKSNLVTVHREHNGDGQAASLQVDSILGKSFVSMTKGSHLMLGENYRGAFIFSDSSPVLVVSPVALGVLADQTQSER